MAKILLIISALVIAATAYLGFATKQKVDGIQDDLKKSKNTLTATQADLSKTKGTLKTTEEALVAAKATIEDREKDLAQKKVDLDKVTADLATAAQKAKDLEERIAKIDPNTSPEEVGKKIEELAASKKQLETDVARLTTEVAEQKALFEGAQAEKKTAEEKLKGSERTVAEYKQGYVRPGVSGTILAYNPGWNFVVLSIGDKHGLKSGAQMVVRRGGQMIGKVKVTSVEPSTSIADIVPGSIPKGMSVQPGDSVIFEGRSQ